MPKIYKVLKKLNTQKTPPTTQLKKWAEDLNRPFSKRTYRMPTDISKNAQHH